MKKIYLVLFVIIAVSLQSSSQVFNSKQFYSYSDHFNVRTICKDQSDSLYTCGFHYYNESFLMKTGSDGGVAWIKTYSHDTYLEFNQILYTSDSSLLIGGRADSNNVAVISKLNLQGDTIWNKVLVLPISQYNYFFNGVCELLETSDSCYLVGGNYRDDQNRYKMFLQKIDKNGNLLWSKFWYNSTDDAKLVSVQENNNQIYILGNDSSTATAKPFLMKLDSNNNIDWIKKYSNDFQTTSVSHGSDFILYNDTFYILARFNGFYSILKTDTLGQIQFLKKVLYTGDAPYANKGHISVTDDNKLVFITNEGEYSNPMSFISVLDLSGSVDKIIELWFYGVDLQVLDNGDVIYLGNGPLIGAKDKEFAYNDHFAFYRTDSLFNIGSCMSELQNNSFFDSLMVDTLVLYIDSLGIFSNFSMDLSETIINVDDDCVSFFGSIEENNIINFTLYPNPTNNFLNIAFQEAQGEEGILEIFSSVGVLLYSENLKFDSEHCLNIDFLPPGMYLLSIRAGEMKGSKWFEVLD